MKHEYRQDPFLSIAPYATGFWIITGILSYALGSIIYYLLVLSVIIYLCAADMVTAVRTSEKCELNRAIGTMKQGIPFLKPNYVLY